MGGGIIPPDGKPSMAGAIESWIAIVVLTNTRIQILFAALLLRLIVLAQCPVDALKVNGRVESASSESKVRVQLVYPRNRPGESGEVSVQDGKFQIPIEFFTAESSLFSNLPKKCGRKPKTVVVTLLENGEESDQVTLNFARAFKMTDASAYGLRSDLVLKGRPRFQLYLRFLDAAVSRACSASTNALRLFRRVAQNMRYCSSQESTARSGSGFS